MNAQRIATWASVAATVACAGVAYQIQELPGRIAAASRGYVAPDTVRVETVRTADVERLNDLAYIDAERFAELLVSSLPGLVARHPGSSISGYYTQLAAEQLSYANRRLVDVHGDHVTTATMHAAQAAVYTARAAGAGAEACLVDFAGCMLSALRACGSPGCEWLWLLDPPDGPAPAASDPLTLGT